MVLQCFMVHLKVRSVGAGNLGGAGAGVARGALSCSSLVGEDGTGEGVTSRGDGGAGVGLGSRGALRLAGGPASAGIVVAPKVASKALGGGGVVGGVMNGTFGVLPGLAFLLLLCIDMNFLYKAKLAFGSALP